MFATLSINQLNTSSLFNMHYKLLRVSTCLELYSNANVWVVDTKLFFQMFQRESYILGEYNRLTGQNLEPLTKKCSQDSWRPAGSWGESRTRRYLLPISYNQNHSDQLFRLDPSDEQNIFTLNIFYLMKGSLFCSFGAACESLKKQLRHVSLNFY